jgi:hypothetical protein
MKGEKEGMTENEIREEPGSSINTSSTSFPFSVSQVLSSGLALWTCDPAVARISCSE